MARIKRSKEALENLQRIYVLGEGGETALSLHLFGDHLSDREGFQGLDGIEAVHFFLMQKHGWKPADLRAMSYADLAFALHQEMRGWRRPSEAHGLPHPLPDSPPSEPIRRGRKQP